MKREFLEGGMKIQYVDTKSNLADILTKIVKKTVFEELAPKLVQ